MISTTVPATIRNFSNSSRNFRNNSRNFSNNSRNFRKRILTLLPPQICLSFFFFLFPSSAHFDSHVNSAPILFQLRLNLISTLARTVATLAGTITTLEGTIATLATKGISTQPQLYLNFISTLSQLHLNCTSTPVPPPLVINPLPCRSIKHRYK